MSKNWGPLGWMTLHSMSLLYPDTPSNLDKAKMSRFLDAFTNTISCIYCKTHFKELLATYRSSNPDFLRSRNEFMLFTFRAHNSVNQRLEKPVFSTVAQCITTIRNADSYTSLKNLRIEYLSYLTRNWNHEQSGDAMIIRKDVKDMVEFNKEFDNTYIDWNISLEEDVLPQAFGKTTYSGTRTKKRGGFLNGKLIF